MTDAILGERVRAVEVTLENLKEDVSAMKRELDKIRSEMKLELDAIRSKQDRMLEILTQARGMQRLFRWGLWIAGGMLSTVGGVWSYWPQLRAILLKLGS